MKVQKKMPTKIIKIKVSNASKLQIQTLLLELGLIAKQWFRKVKVKIEVTKQKGENMQKKLSDLETAFSHQKDYDRCLSYWLRAYFSIK